jgi:hypothetical protein
LILSAVPAATVDTTVADGAAILTQQTIDVAQSYTVEALIVPWEGAFHGKYRLYLRMASTPAIGTAGVTVELTSTGTSGAYSITLTNATTVVHTATGTITPRAGWLSATVVGDNVTVYWCDTEVISSHAVTAPAAGSMVGFGLVCSVAGGVNLVNVFRLQYYSTAAVNSLRSILVASADGDLWRETEYRRLEKLSTTLSLSDSSPLMATQSGQELYIADWCHPVAHSTDGTVAGTTFDDAAGKNWVTLGVSAADMVVVVSNPTGTAVAGTYKISTVAAGTITLSSSAGTGSCSYRIERAPKVYDPLLETLSLMTATLSGTISTQTSPGQVPSGCPLICRFMDRVVFAGGEVAPHVWYMSRQGYPLDWDYSQEDVQAAIAGTASAAGVPGEGITALVPHSDDYLILGCRNSLWRMRGDPASGGQLDCISHAVGIIGPKAWCLTPDGILVFLSLDGIYGVLPGGDAFPQAMSRPMLPRELQNLNPDELTISLEYDIQGTGIHIYLTPTSSNTQIHWWMDWNRKTFWPMSLSADHEPTATCTLQATAIEESGVILGGRDGKLRRMNDLSEDDCGTDFTSYAVLGPVALNSDLDVGTVHSLDAVIAEDSGDVTWALQPSLTFEGTFSATATSTGTWVAGINATVHPDARGQAFVLKLTGETGRRWALEQITATVKTGGRRRIP